MTTYQYTITYTDRRGFFHIMEMNTLEKFFSAAVALDAEQAEIEDAYREVYEVRGNEAIFTRVEHCRMGIFA